MGKFQRIFKIINMDYQIYGVVGYWHVFVALAKPDKDFFRENEISV